MTNQMALLDMNYFFHEGCRETPDISNMMSNTGDGSFGFVMWEEYKEEDFVPNLFTPYSLFKLLFKDNVMTPGWVHDFSHEDIFVMTLNQNGTQVDAGIKIDNEFGDIVLTSNSKQAGKLIIIGKPTDQELPQFYVKDITEWQEDGDNFKITIPQLEHNFIGGNIIEEIRDSKGNVIDLYADVTGEYDLNLKSNKAFNGRLSLYGNVNQPNMFIKTYAIDDWQTKVDGGYYIELDPSEHMLNVDNCIVRVKDEKNTSVGVYVNINPNTKVIRVESNLNKVIKIMLFKEDLFYSLNFSESLWMTAEPPYEIRIPISVHGLFKVPDKIMHHIKRISLTEFGYLPTRLQNLFNTYFTNKGLWLVVEDVEDVYESILVDPDRELPLLNILLKTKDFVFGGSEYGSTEKSWPVFQETYYNDFENLTPLMKVIACEMYYLHYNKTDDFFMYENIIDQIPSLYVQAEKSAYHLMVILYSYGVINKIMSRKILTDTFVQYTPDYWDNK